MKCLWYVSESRPECGDEATDMVRVKGKITKGSIPVCPKHKAEHDENFASIRVASKK